MSSNPRYLTVDVAAEDMERGRSANCGLCLIALAIARLVNWCATVDVGRLIVGIRGLSKTHGCQAVLPLPPAAKAFLARFDEPESRCQCTPFRFELPLPTDAYEPFARGAAAPRWA